VTGPTIGQRLAAVLYVVAGIALGALWLSGADDHGLSDHSFIDSRAEWAAAQTADN